MRDRYGKIRVVILAVLMMIFSASCGREYAKPDPEKDVLLIRKDLGIEVTVSGDFDQPYYNENELVESVEEELARYNADCGENRISILEHHTEAGKAYLTLLFAGYEDCAEYLGIDLYVGNVQGASDEGYDFTQALINVKNTERVIGKNDLKYMADRRIVICSEDYVIICPDRIDYYSYGMELTDKDSAQLAPSDPDGSDAINKENVLIY